MGGYVGGLVGFGWVSGLCGFWLGGWVFGCACGFWLGEWVGGWACGFWLGGWVGLVCPAAVSRVRYTDCSVGHRSYCASDSNACDYCTLLKLLSSVPQ